MTPEDMAYADAMADMQDADGVLVWDDPYAFEEDYDAVPAVERLIEEVGHDHAA